MITLNLLPPARKQLLIDRRRNRRITVGGSLLVTILLLVTLTLFGSTLYVGAVVSSQKRRIEQTQDNLKRYASIEQLVLSIRDRVAALSAQEQARLMWSEVAEELAAATPEGVQITQLAFSLVAQPNFQFSGQADSKEKVATLRERLEESDRFETVSIRQIGQAETGSGQRRATFSMDAQLAGVAAPKTQPKPAGAGE